MWCLAQWRHAMTSQKLFHLSQVVDLLERWSCSWFHGSSGGLFWKCVRVFVGWYHVITSRHDVTSILSITLQPLLMFAVGPNWDSYSNSMVIWVVGIKQINDTIFTSCRQHVITSRHDVSMWRHTIVWNWSNIYYIYTIYILYIYIYTSMPTIFTYQLKWFAGLFCCLRIFINSLQVFLIPLNII